MDKKRLLDMMQTSIARWRGGEGRGEKQEMELNFRKFTSNLDCVFSKGKKTERKKRRREKEKEKETSTPN